MINEDKWESSTNQNIRFFVWMIKIFVWLYPPMGKTGKIEQCQIVNFDECSEYFFDTSSYFYIYPK